jgi:hypothetical protein
MYFLADAKDAPFATQSIPLHRVQVSDVAELRDGAGGTFHTRKGAREAGHGFADALKEGMPDFVERQAHLQATLVPDVLSLHWSE